MELVSALFILSIWIGVSWLISSFFDDRQISRMAVFWLSLLLSPIIGILIGLSSERKKNPKRFSSKTNIMKNEMDSIMGELKRFKELEEVGLLDEVQVKQREFLKTKYKELENQVKEKETLSNEMAKRNLRSRSY